MDLFEHRYYRLNKMSMKLCGQWPEQSRRVRSIKISIIFSIVGTLLIPQLIAIVKNLDDLDFFLEGAMSLLFGIYFVAKLFFAAFNKRKMLMLLNHIRMDYKVWAEVCDVDILHEYAQKGKIMTVVYAVMSYTTCAIFMSAPIVPKIVDVLLRNGTKPGQFPILVDYYYDIDMQKYYFYIILHCILCASVAFTFGTTYSCMFIVIVQHGCGLFAALGRKLQRMGKNEKSSVGIKMPHKLNKQDVELKNLWWCIDRHHDALKYAELIEATYSWCFFVIMGLNILEISLTGLQIVKRTVDRQKMVSFIVCNLLATGHLYFENYMAQNLIDHSISIRCYILNGEWYKFPLNTQKLLLLMLMRCHVPCKLTVGKMFTLSLETFGVFLKTSLSYLAALRAI